MAEISRHTSRSTDHICVGNSAVVVTGSYNIGSQRICKARIEVYIYDVNTPANSDFAVFEIFFLRGGNGAVIRRTVAVIPFVLPGTLSGSAVTSALVNGPAGNGNTIETRFTNPSTGNRSIRVITDFHLITIQD